MSAEVVALVVLVLVFLIASVRSVNMGALALVAAAVVGATVYDVGPAAVLEGFPGNLFVILVGVTYLFALAKNNGTVDWIVHAAVRAVGGRVALVPWAMFAVCAAITAIGAITPAAVAIVAPVALGFARRFSINPVLIGILVVMGATGGSFSPIGIFGAITNGVVSDNALPGSPLILFLGCFGAAVLISLVVFFAFGGRELLSRRDTDRVQNNSYVDEVAGAAARTATRTGVTGTPQAAVESSGRAATISGMGGGPSDGNTAGTGDATAGTGPQDDDHRLNGDRILTLIGLVGLAVGAFAFDLDVGFTALGVAVVLTLISPKSAKGAVDKISWGTVLLIGGIVTYVSLLEDQGTVQWLGDQVATVGAPLLAAFLICLIGAVVSAFASTTGILGALIPLAVPFLLTGQVGAVGLVTALAISSSMVDCSPFSTNGALIVANAEEKDRELVFRRLMQWGMSIVVAAPVLSWALLVLPGWL
ncbi:SLC13 family permease [Nakamurella deserti]|uniref:SLC13 family permease n=1 Tax=Nakamurella deserti TaxID=2164074 RepID=UPI000DBE8A81|nr:SLC13 family permease [Nakamurella deserti]